MTRQESRHSGFVPVQVLTIFLLLCPGLPSACGSAANTLDRSGDGSQGAEWNSGRPRLFFTPEKIDRLRQRIERDEQLRQAWLQIKQRADRQLKEELVSREYAEGGTGQHGNYGRPGGQLAGMASTLGLAYRMTGKEEYARKLKEALLHYGGLTRWAGDAGNIPPWHSELNTATFCFGYAVGYDSIGTTPIRMQAHSSCSMRANPCSSIPAVAPTAGRSIPVTTARARRTMSSWSMARRRIPKIVAGGW